MSLAGHTKNHKRRRMTHNRCGKCHWSLCRCIIVLQGPEPIKLADKW